MTAAPDSFPTITRSGGFGWYQAIAASGPILLYAMLLMQADDQVGYQAVVGRLRRAGCSRVSRGQWSSGRLPALAGPRLVMVGDRLVRVRAPGSWSFELVDPFDLSPLWRETVAARDGWAFLGTVPVGSLPEVPMPVQDRTGLITDLVDGRRVFGALVRVEQDPAAN